jgi:aspartyl-tRNA(Asn)/glutamyl-tRNA(Gln) amidotransferase subunit C
MEIDIDHVAHLARLDLTPSEKAHLAPQLNSILEYVGLLGKLDTRDIEATFQVLPQTNRLRDDVEAPSLTPDEVLANAPAREDDFFRMPRILDKD